MNEQNTSFLFKRFPELFRGRSEPITQNLMSFGFEHGDGWFPIIYSLCLMIERESDFLMIEQPKVVQVKEKYGGLRFYADGCCETIRGMIDMAEEMSYAMCEECGSTKNIGQTTGWIITLCKECHEKEEHKHREWKEIVLS